MITDQEILDYIFSKWGKKTEMRQLNEQYRYTPPYPTLHLEDFIPAKVCLLYTSPSPRDQRGPRMPSSA